MTKKMEIRGASDMPPMAKSLGRMSWNLTGAWRNVTPVIDYEKCTRCMICWKFCPDLAITCTEPPEIILEYCKGCGVCAQECPVKCIEMKEGL
jgi:2-oxoacid:acceptor oxidoreductase delta subunit (pyruvate/2-ketoisovalerate family)